MVSFQPIFFCTKTLGNIIYLSNNIGKN